MGQLESGAAGTRHPKGFQRSFLAESRETSEFAYS